MGTFNKTNITAAFTTVARLVREGQPVVLSQIAELNSVNQQWFRLAVTHSFTKEKHGVDLQRIFIVNKENPHDWHRNTSPNQNPQSVELIDRILLAMQWVSKHRDEIRPPQKKAKPKKEEKMVKPTSPEFKEAIDKARGQEQVKPLSEYSTRELRTAIAELNKELDFRLEKMSRRLGIPVADFQKVAEELLELI